jgi:hypothetical protein
LLAGWLESLSAAELSTLEEAVECLERLIGQNR